MLEKLVFPQGRRAYPLVAATLAVLFILTYAPQCVAEQPTATAVITDRATLPASTRFSVPNHYKLASTGDVYFTSGSNSGLFRWSQAAGRQRLLQTNDPLEKLGIPGLTEEYAGSLLDTTGALLQANAAGQAAFVVSVAIKGGRDPAAIFVYDGSSYRIVDEGVGLETFSQLFLNASGRVAVLGTDEAWNTGPQRIYVQTPSGVVESVAEQGQSAYGITGKTYGTFQLVGFNNAGALAFLAEIQGGGINRAVYIYDNSGMHLVVKSTDSVSPGTFNLRSGVGNYILNAAGEVAFAADVSGGNHPGIWIGSASAPPVKVIRLNEATGTPLGGSFSISSVNTPFALRGFNDAGQVLFSSNVSGGTSPHALFLRDLSPAATQVVFSKGQSGGPAGIFDTTQQASLNNAGNIVFSATLTAGSSPIGWYFDSGTTDPVKIVAQGDITPAGGTFGLAGRNAPALLDAGNQVLFLADILDLNAVGLFFWTGGSGVRSVVSSRDSLPAGANTVLRAEPPSTSDTETLVRVLKAGGQAAFYAKQLKPGMSGLRKIVTEFDQVPGAGTVVRPVGFSMNRKGEVVFTAALLGSDFYPRSGILGSRPGKGVERAVLVGDSAAGDGSFTGFSSPQLNNQTQVAFFANTTAGQGIFIASEAIGIQAVARQNNLWPGPGGGTFGSFNAGSVLGNDGGQVGFRADRSGGGSGLFVGTAGATPAKVVATGDTLPVSLTGFPTTLKMNATGQVAFVASIAGGGGVFLGAGGAEPRFVARTGVDEALGTDGGTFAFFNSNTIDLNSSGQVAFWTGVSNSGNNTWNGWYLGAAGAVASPRLLQHQPLPGGGHSGNLTPGSRLAVLADSGEMAIYVADTSETDIQPQLVIAGVDGKLRKFAGNGEKAEGTGSEFAKLYPTLVATPSGKFLFSAVLINGPAKAGIFINKP